MKAMNGYSDSATGAPALSSDEDAEGALISASQKGEAGAFNRLVLRWEKTVFNVALRMLQDRDEAEEATQEAFLLAFKNIRRFRQDAKFSTWIYRIAVNHCINRVKQRPPGVHASLDARDGPVRQLQIAAPQPSELLHGEQRRRVNAALDSLLPEQRAVIELKFFQELTFEEISAVLDVPASTVKSRLYSGLEMLKAKLGSKE